MADFDEDQIFGRKPPKSVPTHAIGQGIDDLSAPELVERIGILKTEIARIERGDRSPARDPPCGGRFFQGVATSHVR